MLPPLLRDLVPNLQDVVRIAIRRDPALPALILHDDASPLARLLTEGYRLALGDASLLDIPATEPATVLATIDALPARALVVLVQSTRFTLGAFRFRLELFRRGLAVIEHAHLARIREEELPVYVDAMGYDPVRFRGLGAALKARLDVAARVELVGDVGTLAYAGPMEDTKLNVGDYTGFPAIGGQFPIGEVFTEAVDLEAVNGVVPIGAWGAADFSMSFASPPFHLVVERGRVLDAPGAPSAFLAILEEIRAVEGQVWLRELGFGLNPGLTAERTVSDVSTYERMSGVHLSLGAKHPVYPKAGFTRRNVQYHVDVFPALRRATIDGATVYEDGRYTLAPATLT